MLTVELNSIILGISITLIAFLLMHDDNSLLKTRIYKIAKRRHKVANSIAKNMAEVIGSYGKENKKNKQQIAKTKLLLMQAGEDSNEDNVIIFEGRKLILMLFTAIIITILLFKFGFTTNNLGITIFILLLIYKLPEMALKQKIAKRQKEFIANLPDAIDLLSICVKAGLGLDSALNRVASEFTLTSKVVAGEFDRLNRDILSGLTKQEAYRNMALCNPNEEVKSFVALLVQTDKLGTSITQSLDAYCDSVRTRRKQRIEEQTQKAATKMTIPMVIFMLPAIFLIILYPALSKIMTNMNF